MESLIILLIFFATTPNLGFFTLPSFFILMVIALIFLLILLYPNRAFFQQNKLPLVDLKFISIILLIYSSIYYGGLYQNTQSINLGYWLFFCLIIYSFLKLFFLKKSKYELSIIVIFYLALSFWTIINSPAPIVDVFVILKEAPLKFINGINPYSANFTQIYANIKRTYFGYLPFSFLFFLPFVIFLGDPRYGIIFANLISVYVLNKIFKKRGSPKNLSCFLLMFLFAPRGFYMLEHTYLEPIIFSFFLLYLFFYTKLNYGKASIFLSLFFSFKQNYIVLFPLIITKRYLLKLREFTNLILLLLPSLIPLYFFLIDKQSFIRNTILIMNPNVLPSPITNSLSLQTFLVRMINANNLSLSGIMVFFLLIIYIICIRKKVSVILKVALFLFFFHFLMYQSFFNHYYIVALFLLLDIMMNYFGLEVEV